MGMPEAALDFLRDLDEHNDKDWFQANKKRYERDFKKPGRALVDEVNARLEVLSPRHVTPANKAINRINRDIRFSADKTPYNVKLWAKFLPGDRPKGLGVGFYFGFDLESFSVGAGVWAFPKEKLDSIRTGFAETHDRYRQLLADPGFAPYRNVTGDAYKRVPKPWPADHPAADLLVLKGIHTRRELDYGLVTSDGFADAVADEFERMLPFVEYVQDVLDC